MPSSSVSHLCISPQSNAITWFWDNIEALRHSLGYSWKKVLHTHTHACTRTRTSSRRLPRVSLPRCKRGAWSGECWWLWWRGLCAGSRRNSVGIWSHCSPRSPSTSSCTKKERVRGNKVLVDLLLLMKTCSWMKFTRSMNFWRWIVYSLFSHRGELTCFLPSTFFFTPGVKGDLTGGREGMTFPTENCNSYLYLPLYVHRGQQCRVVSVCAWGTDHGQLLLLSQLLQLVGLLLCFDEAFLHVIHGLKRQGIPLEQTHEKQGPCLTAAVLLAVL